MIYFFFIFFTLILYRSIFNIPQGYNSFYLSNSKSLKRFTIVSCLLLIGIIAFKDISVGTDTERYYIHFLYDEMPDWHNGNVAGEELGFRYLQYYCREFGLHWLEYSFITSFIIVAPMGYFLYKYSDNVWASLMFYITIGLFSHNMTALRQSLAVSMVLIAIISIFNRKYIMFIVFVLIGYLFHYTALAALVIGILPFIKYKNNLQLTILLFVPIIVKIAGGVLFNIIGVYLPERYDGYESQTFTMNPILEVMWLSILVFCWHSLVRNKNVSNKDFLFYLLTVCFVSSIELSGHIYMASRLSHYFETALVAAIPCFIYKYPPSGTRDFMALSIYALCMLAFLFTLTGSDTLSISNYIFMKQYY